MKKLINKIGYLFLATVLCLSACSDDDDPSSESGDTKFVIMSATEKWDAGYITAYDDFPSGTVEKLNTNSLQVNNAFGFRSYKKWFFNRSNAGGDEGLQKYSINDDGSIKDEGFIASASQYLVVDETHGYYLDENRGTLKIQTFNPTAMHRTGEIDLTTLKKDGVEYQVVGKHTLAAKDGKLYAGITYGTIAAQGYEGNVFDYVEFAVIDMASNTLDKTIKYDGLRSIGWGSSGNKMWSIGDDGALYLYSTGLSVGFSTSSVIRINKGETDFDKSFIIKAVDYTGPSSIATGLVENGKLYIELSSVAMVDDFSNLQDIIMDYYSIDLTSKMATKITGMPQHHYAYANDQAITEIDGKVYFWVRNLDQKIDGYYELNSDGTSATQVFNVGHDGFMWGFVKLED
jgi:hypothetical protein